MDLRLLLTTFVSVFLAELGDKTQLATLAFASESRSRVTVFVGAAAALVLSSALAVALGDGISRVLPPIWLKRASGTAFVVIGVWILYASSRSN